MSTTEQDEIVVQDVKWHLDYQVHVGRTWGRFLEGLRNGQILGTQCAGCDRVRVPAQSYCENCFREVTDWVELPDEGTLQAHTISYHEFQGSPPAPYALGAIQLDGATTVLMHQIGEIDLSSAEAARQRLRRGSRVKAVWAEDRKGHILDIQYFRLVS